MKQRRKQQTTGQNREQPGIYFVHKVPGEPFFVKGPEKLHAIAVGEVEQEMNTAGHGADQSRRDKAHGKPGIDSSQSPKTCGNENSDGHSSEKRMSCGAMAGEESRCASEGAEPIEIGGQACHKHHRYSESGGAVQTRPGQNHGGKSMGDRLQRDAFSGDFHNLRSALFPSGLRASVALSEFRGNEKTKRIRNDPEFHGQASERL